MSFAQCPSIRGCLVHDPALLQMFPAFFTRLQQENIRIPAQGQIRIQLKVTNFMKIQAGMVMDQPFPLCQAPVMWFDSGVGDRGDLEFGSDTTPLMKAI